MNECVHYFVIESPVPDKPLLEGVCSRCGATRMHDAYIPDSVTWAMGKQRRWISYKTALGPDDWQFPPDNVSWTGREEENYDP